MVPGGLTMKKKMIFSVMIVMMVGTVGMPLMASGAQEGADNFTRPYEQLEEKTLTGEVAIGTDGRARLIVEGQEYELMYPFIAAADLEVETGDVVTVEGAVVPGPRWQEDEDALYFHVSGAVIDGEEYDLDDAYGYGMNGRRGGPGAMGGQAMNGRPMMGRQGNYSGPAGRGAQTTRGSYRGSAGGPAAKGGAWNNGPSQNYGAPGQVQGGPGMRRF